MGGAAGYWKHRLEALNARQGGLSADNAGVVDRWDWAGVEMEACRVLDGLSRLIVCLSSFLIHRFTELTCTHSS